MHELTTNLEPGNPDGHTVLRYLVEAKQMPLDVAIERVYKAVGKYAAEYRSDQNKLLTGMLVTGVLGLPVLFPFGVSSLLIAGSIGASVVSWQELGAMRDRLKPELACLKQSVLLEQFIKWLAEEVKKRRGQPLDSPTTPFQADAITTANILTAYEHTVFSVAQGEHLENNASDPILALFVVKLRQHTNHLPNWVMDAFRHLEQAEAQRSSHLEAAYGYMFGNLSQSPVGQNTRLGAVDVPAQSVEGENRLGKPIETNQYQLPPSQSTSINLPTAYSRILECPFESRAYFGSQRTGKTYLAAVSSYSLHTQGKKIYHINLGSYGTEDDIYWNHAKSVRGDLSVLDAIAAGYLIEEAISLVDEFYQQSGAILIVDEWAYIGSINNAHAALLEPLMKLLADKITTLSSTGMKREKAIWAIAPELVASSLTNQAKAIKKLKLCYVSIAPGKFVDWNGNPISFNAELFEQVKNNFPITSPDGIRFAEDRICFIDNKWHPLGELPSLPKANPVPAETVPLNQTVEQLERSWNISKESKELPSSEITLKLLEIIKAATKYPISFESIRKSRKWGENSPEKAILLSGLNELIPDWIRGNEDEGYYLQD